MDSELPNASAGAEPRVEHGRLQVGQSFAERRRLAAACGRRGRACFFFVRFDLGRHLLLQWIAIVGNNFI